MRVPNVDLSTISAFFNIGAGLATIWLMQCITKQAGTTSTQAWLKYVQRGVLMVIALALIWNGGATLDSETVPRAMDFALEMVLLLPLLLFAVRHVMAGKINQEVREYAPGTELPVFRTLWAVWARLSAVGVAAAIAVICVFWLMLPGRPVFVVKHQEGLTKTTVAGTTVQYSILFDRLRPCPGYISDFYTTRTGPAQTRTQVTLRRPIKTWSIQSNTKLDVTVSSPRPIKGPAHYRSVLVSSCPEGEREDTIVEFDYEAIDPEATQG